jgi:hypothetical protein
VCRDAPASWPDYEEQGTTTIVNALADAGYSVTRADAHRAWKQHSADECAGWLSLPGASAIVEILTYGTDPDDLTLNGRGAGPFLVSDNPAASCIHGTHVGDCPFCNHRKTT